MIKIINVSKKPKQSGPHKYHLMINNILIAEFKHNREESLATCLRKAANAAEIAESNRLLAFFQEYYKPHN